MSAAQPQSFLGWLDYNESDARRMREVFAAFDDKGTIDSLGLGVVRDALADQMFPGVSTVQTRARYFLFLPWIFQRLENESVAPARFPERLRTLETTLIESLRQCHGAAEGVIGYRARGRLSRFPSSIYWNGLGVLGIRVKNVSLSDYRGMVQHASRHIVDTDDDGHTISASRGAWDPGLPAVPRGFLGEAIDFVLEPLEADYLVERVLTHCPDTLFAELARDLSLDRDVPLPWEVYLPHVSTTLREVLMNAQNFSELVHGAQALYNLLLVNRAEAVLGFDADALRADLEDEIEEWAALIEQRRHTIRKWLASGSLWTVTARVAPVSARTRRFVHDWGELVLSDSARGWRGKAAEALIRHRELSLKGKLARLTELRPLENWTGEPFGRGQMSFRWGNAKRILDDIQQTRS